MQTNNMPALNIIITFLPFLFPFTAVPILSENKAQIMAAIINNTEKVSMFPLCDLRFVDLIIAQGSCHINMPLQKPPESYASSTYLKRDGESPPILQIY